MVEWLPDSSNTLAVPLLENWVHEFCWGNEDKNGKVPRWNDSDKVNNERSNSPHSLPSLESFVDHIEDNCCSTRDLTELLLFPLILSLPPSEPTILTVD